MHTITVIDTLTGSEEYTAEYLQAFTHPREVFNALNLDPMIDDSSTLEDQWYATKYGNTWVCRQKMGTKLVRIQGNNV